MTINISDVTTRLKTFGYDAIENDIALIEYLIASVEQEILNFTNLEEVPEGLKYEWIDAVCGEFLKLAFGSKKLEGLDQIVKSIKEGDTTVTLAEGMSTESQFLSCIKALRLNKGAMVRHRVLTW